VAIKISDHRGCNSIDIDPYVLQNSSGFVSIKGSGNTISLRRCYILPDHQSKFSISIEGDGHEITFEGGGSIHAISVVARQSQCRLMLGRGVTLTGHSEFAMHETSSITVGPDCMLAPNVRFRTSDAHPIVDATTRERLNPARDITVGEHVWLAAESIVLKGADIGAGSIVATRSVVTGTIPVNSLAAGVPARVIRSNVTWERHFRDEHVRTSASTPIS
jgi:acetyltransferase-like isoleucine patch superfamily enzyme